MPCLAFSSSQELPFFFLIPLALFFRYLIHRTRLRRHLKGLTNSAADFWLNDAEKAAFRSATESPTALSCLPQVRWLEFNKIAHRHLRVTNALLAWIIIVLEGYVTYGYPVFYHHDSISNIAPLGAALVWMISREGLTVPAIRYTPTPARVTLDNLDHPEAVKSIRTVFYRFGVPLFWLIMSLAMLRSGMERRRETEEKAYDMPVSTRPTSSRHSVL